MKNSIFFHKKIEIQEFKATSHGVGKKFVFCNGNECESNLTQAAIGIFKIGEVVDEHQHPY
jgi:hypothetical protein